MTDKVDLHEAGGQEDSGFTAMRDYLIDPAVNSEDYFGYAHSLNPDFAQKVWDSLSTDEERKILLENVRKNMDGKDALSRVRFGSSLQKVVGRSLFAPPPPLMGQEADMNKDLRQRFSRLYPEDVVAYKGDNLYYVFGEDPEGNRTEKYRGRYYPAFPIGVEVQSRNILGKRIEIEEVKRPAVRTDSGDILDIESGEWLRKENGSWNVYDHKAETWRSVTKSDLKPLPEVSK